MFRLSKFAALILASCLLFSGGQLLAAEAEELSSETEKISYVLGYSIINNLKKDFQVDLESLIMGIEDGEAGKTQMSPEEMQKIMALFQQRLQKEQMEKMQQAAAANKAAGEAFLEENKKNKEVITLQSGLQYKVLREGDGPSPSASDTVTCHYEGKTIDGQVFDSSYQRDKPASFKVDGVIEGWTEALQLMQVGAKWMLYIPSDLAYGDQGAGQAIEPGSTLIFQVELLEVTEKG